MRIRNIKPEFWRSRDITALNTSARLTFIGLWNYVDDNGVGLDDIVAVAADLYAHDLANDVACTLQQITCDLHALDMRGLILRYSTENRPLLYVTGWDRHQYIPRPSKGHLYPLPPAETLDQHANRMSTACEQHAGGMEITGRDRGTGGQGDGGSEGRGVGGSKGEKPRTAHRLPDDWEPPESVVAQMRNDHPHVNQTLELAKFRDYWTAQPGAKGRKLNWVGVYRNWIRREAEKHRPRRGNSLSTVDQKVNDWLTADIPADDDYIEAVLLDDTKGLEQ